MLQRGELEEELLEIIPNQVEVSVDDFYTNSILVEDVCLEEPTCEPEDELSEIGLNKVKGHATSTDYCDHCDWWGHPPCVDYCWTCQLWGHLDREHLLIDIVPDEDVPDEVVDCAIIASSPFLSDGMIFIEDEPHVDALQVMIDESHLSVDKLQVLCVPYTPSFKRSLEEIQLLEFDGDYRGKKGNESKKRRCICREHVHYIPIFVLYE